MQRIWRCSHCCHVSPFLSKTIVSRHAGFLLHACSILKPKIFFVVPANLYFISSVVILEAGTQQSTLKIDQTVLGGGYHNE